MKRILIVSLCAATLITAVGCAPKNDNQPKNELVNNTENSENSNEIIYFGKVKSIVGNEVELEIAENQDGNNGDESSGKEEGVYELPPGASHTDTASDIAISDGGESGGEGGESPGPGIYDSNKLELKYTGETKKIIIPTGVNILDLRSGKEAKITSIKSGTVIRINAAGTKEAPIVSSLEIVE